MASWGSHNTSNVHTALHYADRPYRFIQYIEVPNGSKWLLIHAQTLTTNFLTTGVSLSTLWTTARSYWEFGNQYETMVSQAIKLQWGKVCTIFFSSKCWEECVVFCLPCLQMSRYLVPRVKSTPLIPLKCCHRMSNSYWSAQWDISP